MESISSSRRCGIYFLGDIVRNRMLLNKHSEGDRGMHSVVSQMWLQQIGIMFDADDVGYCLPDSL